MDNTEYQDAWKDGEEADEKSEPLQHAAETARRKMEDDRREYEEAYATAGEEPEGEKSEGEKRADQDDKESQE